MSEIVCPNCEAEILDPVTGKDLIIECPACAHQFLAPEDLDLIPTFDVQCSFCGHKNTVAAHQLDDHRCDKCDSRLDGEIPDDRDNDDERQVCPAPTLDPDDVGDEDIMPPDPVEDPANKPKRKQNWHLEKANKRRHLATLEDRAEVWRLRVKEKWSWQQISDKVGKAKPTCRKYYYDKIAELHELIESDNERRAKKLYIGGEAETLLKHALARAKANPQYGAIALQTMKFLDDFYHLSELGSGESDDTSTETENVIKMAREKVSPAMREVFDEIEDLKKTRARKSETDQAL